MKTLDDCICDCHRNEDMKHVVSCCTGFYRFQQNIADWLENLENKKQHPLSNELIFLAAEALIVNEESKKLSPEKWAHDLVESMKDEKGKLPND